MKKSVHIITFIFLLASCATPPTHMAEIDRIPDITSYPDKAKLVIIREIGNAPTIVFWNYLDGRLIGEARGMTYFITPVTPGPHYVMVAAGNACAAHFDFKPGKTYFLGVGVSAIPFHIRTYGFYPMAPEDAAIAMMKSRYLEYDPKTGQEDMDPKLYQQAIDEYFKSVKEDPSADILKYDGVVMK